MTEPKRPRVLVAADAPEVRARIVRALEAERSSDIVSARAMDDSIVDACRSLEVDLLLVVARDLRATSTLCETIMCSAPVAILAVTTEAVTPAAENELLEAGVVEVISSIETDAHIARTARLVARIPVVTRRRTTRRSSDRSGPNVAPPASVQTLPGVVAIGASTGGPAVVTGLLKGLPPGFPLPVLVVVHIGPNFGYSFADWLGGSSRLPVHQAGDGAEICAGHVYVCPPERHLVVVGDRLRLTRDPERHSCRPSVDVLFESVAEQFGARAIGCLLTGIGKDGATGLLAMRRRGAYTIAQDEESCAVFGMPREAIAIGAAEAVAAPARIVSLLVRGASELASASGVASEHASKR